MLIDTDVLLDFFLDREPFSRHAAEILSLSEKGEVCAHVTPVICSNLYYILRRLASHQRVMEKLRTLLRIVDVLPMNGETVLQALEAGFSDFEDGLQHAAALGSGRVAVIVTRNVKDYRKSALGVFQPEDYLKLIRE